MAKRTKKYDPLNIDKTPYADALRKIAKRPFDDHAPEPIHPLLRNTTIQDILEYLQKEKNELARSYDLQSEDSPANPYFRSSEGLELRPEVVIALILHHLNQNRF